jgi:hypothetical protein
MKESNVQNMSEGLHHFHSAEKFSHLCGPIKRPEILSMQGFTSRIILTPQIKNLSPEIVDYARFLNSRPMFLTRLGYQNVAVEFSRPVEVASCRYNLLVHEGEGPEHELTRLINAAVPTNLPMELRADICQDLAVGILCGDFDKENLALPIKELVKRMNKMFPAKWGDLSLNAPISGTDGLTLMDTI